MDSSYSSYPYILIEKETIDSTQVEAKRLLSSDSSNLTMPFAITAQEQLQGRGRSQRQWISPKGKNVSLTLGFEVPLAFRKHTHYLAAMACLAIQKAIKSQSGIDATVKWPNDIVVRTEKKLAGVLVDIVSLFAHDCNMANSAPQVWALIGVGINVNMSQEECFQITNRQATSFVVETQQKYDLNIVSKACIESILESASSYATKPHLVTADLRQACHWMIGKEITTHDSKGYLIRGIVQEVTLQGNLILQEISTQREHVLYILN